MKYYKQIEVGLELRNYIEVVADVNGIMKVLKEKYEGIAFRGVYIVEVVEIIRQSDIIITTNGQPLTANMSIIFLALVEEYKVGDVVVGLNVESKDGDALKCTTDDNKFSTYVIAKSLYGAIKTGDKILAKIDRVEYDNGLPNITAVCSEFAHKKTFTAYKFSGQLSAAVNDEARAAMDLMMGLVSGVMARIDELRSRPDTRVEFYEKALRVRTPPRAASYGHTIVSVATLDDIIKWAAKPGTVLRENDMDVFRPEAILVTNGAQLPATITVDSVHVDVAVMAMVQEYLEDMRVLIEMIERYPAPVLKANTSMVRILGALKSAQ